MDFLQHVLGEVPQELRGEAHVIALGGIDGGRAVGRRQDDVLPPRQGRLEQRAVALSRDDAFDHADLVQPESL